MKVQMKSADSSSESFWGDFELDVDPDVVISELKHSSFKIDPPKTLFRYRKSSRALDEIRDEYIYLSPSSEMSDAFDTLMPLGKLMHSMGMISRKQARDVNSFGEFVRDDLCICCFTERHDLFSMWDRYALTYASN
ncbi:MAG: hypothetical protein E7Z68_02495 [Thermoplasmata archaeon]|nr:hypothetical protein [Thermoplasmata archaeon]